MKKIVACGGLLVLLMAAPSFAYNDVNVAAVSTSYPSFFSMVARDQEMSFSSSTTRMRFLLVMVIPSSRCFRGENTFVHQFLQKWEDSFSQRTCRLRPSSFAGCELWVIWRSRWVK